MANTHSSAGVYITELDQSQQITAVATSIGAIVGPAHSGPVNQRTLITSTSNFLSVFGNPDPTLTFMHYSALAFLQQSSQLYVTRVAKNSLYGGMVCQQKGHFNVSAAWSQGYGDPSTEYVFGINDIFIIYGQNQGAWNDNLGIALYPAQPNNFDDNTFWLEVYISPSTVAAERFLCTLNYQQDGYGNQQNVMEQINRNSTLIYVVQNTANAAYVANPKAKIINSVDGVSQFVGGSDGDPVDNSDIINGWALYTDTEEVTINILINGGYSTPDVQLYMDSLCQNRMDCVAILDMPSASQNVADALTYRNSTLNLNSSYSALYSPDLYIADTYNAQKLFVPPSGYIAAIYALTDQVASAWSAPAGMNRGNLNVLALRNIYNQGDRDALDASQINALRVIYGSGIKVWGSSTLQTMSSALSEISVRRLMIMLEQSISQASLYSVFEQNDVILRARLTDIATSFLQPIQNGNGIYAFAVVCNDSNNPPSVIATGDTVLDVYIDPALPVKRIHLNAIIAKTGGITYAISQINGTH